MVRLRIICLLPPPRTPPNPLFSVCDCANIFQRFDNRANKKPAPESRLFGLPVMATLQLLCSRPLGPRHSSTVRPACRSAFVKRRRRLSKNPPNFLPRIHFSSTRAGCEMARAIVYKPAHGIVRLHHSGARAEHLEKSEIFATLPRRSAVKLQRLGKCLCN